MKFEIKNRWYGNVIFECEAISLKAAVEKAVEARVSLRAANLSAANLSAADLSAANLSDANLSAANLRAADLSDANLSAANLRAIKADFFDVLLRAPKEVAGLQLALKEGRVNGSQYEGACACLVGTIANVKGCEYEEIPNLLPDSSRPAEQWFLNIQEGHTPKNSNVAKITAEWIEEFQKLAEAFTA